MKKLELKKRFYVRSFLKSLPHVLGWKLFRIKPSNSSFLNKKLDLESSNAYLKEKILAGEPFAAIRIGEVEMDALNNYEKILLGFQSRFKKSVQYSMKNNTGFFPTTDKNLSFYAKHFFKDAVKTDFMGITGNHMEEYFFLRYMHKAIPVMNELFDSFKGDWIQALNRKRILIITTSTKPYKKQEINKKFESLIDVKIDTLCYESKIKLIRESNSKYSSWFEVLDEIKVEILKYDFDFALIDESLFSPFLAWYIKSSLHKQAMQFNQID